MWIAGRRRGGAKDLASHLLKEENESVIVHELEGFCLEGETKENLTKALKQMEAIGYAKGAKRNLYHAILAPAYGETLTKAQREFMVGLYLEQMGFQGHQYALVEHWKKGKQHFHLVVNIIHPETGRTHELKWTRRKEWAISRQLEQILGLSVTPPKGKSAQTWEKQRGQRSNIDPVKMKKEVTAIYHASTTVQAFIANLNKAGYALTKGRDNKLVLVDTAGDTHGLLRRIEGVRLADVRQKFSGIERLSFPPHEELVKARKLTRPEIPTYIPEFIPMQHVQQDVLRAYKTSKTGAAFVSTLNKRGYILGRTINGFSVVAKNGEAHKLTDLLGAQINKRLANRFPDLAAIRPRYVSEIIRRVKAHNRKQARNAAYGGTSVTRTAALSAQSSSSSNRVRNKIFARTAAAVVRREIIKSPVPVLLAPNKKGWPEEAVKDWEAWGHKNPPRFFTKWPELKPDGFAPLTLSNDG